MFGDSVYINGLYNGQDGLSHRARVPNWSNIELKDIVDDDDDGNCSRRRQAAASTSQFILNTKSGVFQREITAADSGYKIIHRIYAHRYYNRAIINQVNVYRYTSDGKL